MTQERENERLKPRPAQEWVTIAPEFIARIEEVVGEPITKAGQTFAREIKVDEKVLMLREDDHTGTEELQKRALQVKTALEVAKGSLGVVTITLNDSTKNTGLAFYSRNLHEVQKDWGDIITRANNLLEIFDKPPIPSYPIGPKTSESP